MGQLELFKEQNTGMAFETAGYFIDKQETGSLPNLSGLYELSVDAYYAAIHAAMSELPIKAEILRFIEKVRNTMDREAAARAAFNRSDPDVYIVLKAAYKVQHEVHRLTGLLRFKVNHDGVYIARCSPDHFILPALAEHFSMRFGETPWMIIDEKRNYCLCRGKGDEARLFPVMADSALLKKEDAKDGWEDLWRLYHRSVNNEKRKNLKLQRQFMPERYQKYLTELQ